MRITEGSGLSMFDENEAKEYTDTHNTVELDRKERRIRYSQNNPQSQVARVIVTDPVIAPPPGILPINLNDLAKTRVLDKKIENNSPKTGYFELDNLIKGFIPGHLYTLSGETNVGKTAMACNFAVRLVQQGKRVLYLALEPGSRVVDYIASIETKKQFNDLTDEDITKVTNKIEVYEKISTFTELSEALQTISDDFSLVIIDHIGYFIKDSGTNWIQQQENLLQNLARLTKDRKVPIMIIAHLNKPGMGADVMPTMDRIKGSSSFKQDSTEVLLLSRRKKLKDDAGTKIEVGQENQGWLVVLKQKSGKNGPVPLVFQEGGAYITTPDEDRINSIVHKNTEGVNQTYQEAQRIFGVGGVA